MGECGEIRGEWGFGGEMEEMRGFGKEMGGLGGSKGVWGENEGI